MNNNLSGKKPGARQNQMTNKLSTEFAQDTEVPAAAKRVQQSKQNKIKDNFKTPNETSDDLFDSSN